jgi:hypothetical protein
MQRRVHHAGRDGVHADAVVRVLHRQMLGDRFEPAGCSWLVTSKWSGETDQKSGVLDIGMPGWSTGRGPGAGQKHFLSLSAMETLLMLASQRRITPRSFNGFVATKPARARRAALVTVE